MTAPQEAIRIPLTEFDEIARTVAEVSASQLNKDDNEYIGISPGLLKELLHLAAMHSDPNVAGEDRARSFSAFTDIKALEKAQKFLDNFMELKQEK